MGLFEIFGKKRLHPTLPENQRPQSIVDFIDDFAVKLNASSNEVFGDYTDGIRLQLILSYLEAIDIDKEIEKIDNKTSEVIVSYYNFKHWGNSTPDFLHLLSIIKSTSQKSTLMELDIDRAISNKGKKQSEIMGCIQWACLWLNSKNRISMPLLEKKQLAIDCMVRCSAAMTDLVGQLYGSKLLLDASKSYWDNYTNKINSINKFAPSNNNKIVSNQSDGSNNYAKCHKCGAITIVEVSTSIQHCKCNACGSSILNRNRAGFSAVCVNCDCIVEIGAGSIISAAICNNCHNYVFKSVVKDMPRYCNFCNQNMSKLYFNGKFTGEYQCSKCRAKSM